MNTFWASFSQSFGRVLFKTLDLLSRKDHLGAILILLGLHGSPLLSTLVTTCLMQQVSLRFKIQTSDFAAAFLRARSWLLTHLVWQPPLQGVYGGVLPVDGEIHLEVGGGALGHEREQARGDRGVHPGTKREDSIVGCAIFRSSSGMAPNP